MGIFVKRGSTHFHRDQEGNVTGVTRTGDEPVEGLRDRMTKKEHTEVLEAEDGNVILKRDGDIDEGEGRTLDDAVDDFKEDEKLKRKQERYEKKQEAVEKKVKGVELKLGQRKRVADAKLRLAQTKKELKDVKRAERKEKYKPLLSMAQGAKNMGLMISDREAGEQGSGGLGSGMSLDAVHGDDKGGKDEGFFSFGGNKESMFDFSTKKDVDHGSGIGGSLLDVGLSHSQKYDYSQKGGQFSLAIGGGHSLSAQQPKKKKSKKKKRSPPNKKSKSSNKKRSKPKTKHKSKSKKKKTKKKASSGRTEYVMNIGKGLKL
jgi:hypothetical protein